MENKQSSLQPTSTQDNGIEDHQEGSASSILQGFFGFFSAIFSLFLLFFTSSFANQAIGDWNDGLPAIIICVGLLAFFLSLVRRANGYLVTDRGKRMVKVIALVGSCVAPFGLMLGHAWILFLPLIALGTIAMSYLWCIYLCTLSHALLGSLTSMAFAFAACLIGLLGSIELNGLVIILIGCAFALLSWLLVIPLSNPRGQGLPDVTMEESRKRAVTAPVDRWTYVTIGVDFGFSVGALCFLATGITGIQATHDILGTDIRSLTFSIPIIIASILLLILRNRFEFVIEKYSLNFLAFTITVGILVFFILPPIGRLPCLMFLLFVSIIQIIIALNASIEFIRFEELSPIWYLAEGAILACGSCAGLALAWIASTGDPSASIFLICFDSVIAFNVFSRIFYGRGTYPRPDLFQPTEHSKHGDGKTARGGAYWHLRVEHVCKQYDLSPRQSEILELLAKGRDTTYIVEHFMISRSTAKTHIYNIYCKLDIHSKQDMLDMIEAVTLSDDELQQIANARHHLECSSSRPSC